MIDPRHITNTVLAALNAAITTGDGEAPADRAHPYLVLHTIPGGTRDGSWGDPHEDVDVVHEIIAVGDTREQAQAALSRARTIYLGRGPAGYTTPLAGAGWVVITRQLDTDAGVMHEPDDPTYNAVERYRLAVTAT